MAKKKGNSVSPGLRKQSAHPAGRPFQDELRHSNVSPSPAPSWRTPSDVTHSGGKKHRTTGNKQSGIPGGGTIPTPGKSGNIPQPRKGKP
jgi:hypothetical protein